MAQQPQLSSKDMEPDHSPFFTNIFIKNQFRTKTLWPPKNTDLTGKIAVVTGANTGLGLEASDQLLSFKLSRLILASRSVDKGEAAAKGLRTKYPNATIDVFQLDMSSYDSIKAFVAKVEQLEHLDVAILNAGVRKTKFDLVPGIGHEETIQINYTSTALLAMLLLPALKRKSAQGPGQMSIINSGLALAAKFSNRTASPLLTSFDDPKNFDVRDQYNISKLFGMMFLYKLVEYVSADDVVVNVVDPGFVKGTELSRDLSFGQLAFLVPFKAIAARPLDVGASTYVDGAVVKGKESHGCYLMSWKICPFPPLMYTPEGKEIIERLWKETLAELSFAGVQGILDGMRKS